MLSIYGGGPCDATSRAWNVVPFCPYPAAPEASQVRRIDAGTPVHHSPASDDVPVAVETTRIHRVAGRTDGRTAWVTTRPFRPPHHMISDVGLIGGGHVPMPGEVSLAHHGVLFLDKLPEFRRHVLEVLRQPLEERVVYIQFPERPKPL
jgi:hypothetical protein